jgi:predicted transcriptional regulator
MKLITTADPEFGDVLAELTAQLGAVESRRQIAEESLRVWMFRTIEEISNRLGFTIQNLAEIFRDLQYAWGEGYKSGRERARANSIRAKRGRR